MQNTSRLWKFLALLLSLSIIAAACGSDDGDAETDGGGSATTEAMDDGDDTATTEAMDDGDDTATTEAMDDGDDTATTEAMDDGDDVVVSDEAIALPGGASIDLTACPSDWDPMTGISDDTITFGVSLPQSGPLAGFGTIPDGMQAYLDAKGPFDGRNVELIVRDDQYVASNTLANVEEILDTEEVAAFLTTIGTANNLEIRDTLNDECVPQLLNLTGAPEFGDLTDYPWTSGALLLYSAEAQIWCDHLADELGEGGTVAALYANNDFGKSYQDAFEACAPAAGLDIVDTQLHDQAADGITNEITTLAASGADAVVLGTTGAFCPQAMGTIAANEWNPIGLVSSTCSIIELLWAPVGAGANGFRIAVSAKDVSDPNLQDDPAVIETRQILEDAGYDPTEGSLATGVLFGRSAEAVLNRAIELGGLSRPNLIAAMWTLDVDNPGLYDGITNITDGANDAYLIENAVIAEYQWEDPAGSFVPITDVFVAEGTNGSFGG